ncbi:MAG TPA: RNA polymerase subunit sigma-70 [Cytophagales bacterium]|nr:RNA polymerase subunit sigma-70 [Cytophagales bacterium]HAA19014.1 RNA polymerase subunit sigma-70 [Cytophagales bacterium]HAP61810.1 RNA polymerase subunit sigma-70 [Cytophagales bacterium]
MDKSICEEENYTALYTEHVDSVRNLMYYKCGDLDQAEDLAQEAFVRLWKHCAEVAWATAKGFLFTAANRLFLNTISHNKVVMRFEKENPMEHNTPNPEFVMQEQEFKSKLEDAISSLPDRQRQIFLLNRIDKMSYKEIAEHMDISVKAVEKSLGKVMKKLRESVTELKQHKI